MCTHTYAQAHQCTHTCAATSAHTHVCRLTNTHIHTHQCVHTHTCRYSNAHAHVCAVTSRHTHAHTCRHTHSCTDMCSPHHTPGLCRCPLSPVQTPTAAALPTPCPQRVTMGWPLPSPQPCPSYAAPHHPPPHALCTHATMSRGDPHHRTHQTLVWWTQGQAGRVWVTPRTHVGAGEGAELVLQVAGQVVGFLDGLAGAQLLAAVQGGQRRQVAERGTQEGEDPPRVSCGGHGTSGGATKRGDTSSHPWARGDRDTPAVGRTPRHYRALRDPPCATTVGRPTCEWGN